MKRSFTIDAAKAFAVILVIFGHAYTHWGQIFAVESYWYTNMERVYVYSFHMPLFAMISGYLFCFGVNKRSFKETVINRIKTILIPLLSWNSLLFILRMLKRMLSGGEITPINILYSFYNTITYYSWFLWAVLFATAVIAIVHYFFKGNIFAYVAFAILFHFIDVNYIASLLHIKKDALDLWLFLYSYILVGFLFAKYKDRLLQRIHPNKYTKIVVPVVFFILHILLMMLFKNSYTVYNYGVYMIDDFPKSVFVILLRFFAGVLGACSWISLFAALNKEKIPQLIKKLVQTISEASIVIYVFCSYVIGVIFIEFVRLPDMSLPVYIVLDVIVNVIIGILVAEILKKNKLTKKLFIGRK